MSDILENVVGIRLFMWYSVFIKGRELSIPSSRSSASESRKRALLANELRSFFYSIGNCSGYSSLPQANLANELCSFFYRG